MDGTNTPSTPPPAAPNAAAPQAPAAGAPPVQSIDSVYNDFDAAESSPTPPPAPSKGGAPAAPKPAAPTAKPPKTPPASTSDGTGITGEESAPDAGPDGGPTGKPNLVDPKELRTSYANLKTEHQKLKAEFEKLRTSAADSKQVKDLQALLDSERQARAKVEEELKHTAYERSAEFKEKFQAPYMRAYQMGRQKTASLKTVEGDFGDARQGTAEDFDMLMRIDDDDAAAEKATELFGAKAQMVLYYRERVNELHAASRAALEEHRTNLSAREKEQAEAKTRTEQQQAEARENNAKAFRQFVDEGKTKQSEIFTPAEGDDEAKAVLATGEAVAESIWNGINPRTGKPYTPQGLIRFHAFVRNAVAAHGHILHKLQAANARIAELEGSLSEFNESGSSPDAGRGGEKPAESKLRGDEEFDEAERTSTRKW